LERAFVQLHWRIAVFSTASSEMKGFESSDEQRSHRSPVEFHRLHRQQRTLARGLQGSRRTWQIASPGLVASSAVSAFTLDPVVSTSTADGTPVASFTAVPAVWAILGATILVASPTSHGRSALVPSPATHLQLLDPAQTANHASLRQCVGRWGERIGLTSIRARSAHRHLARLLDHLTNLRQAVDAALHLPDTPRPSTHEMFTSPLDVVYRKMPIFKLADLAHEVAQEASDELTRERRFLAPRELAEIARELGRLISIMSRVDRIAGYRGNEIADYYFVPFLHFKSALAELIEARAAATAAPSPKR
jgi:hypothetical protein